jgi:hypothetical protein
MAGPGAAWQGQARRGWARLGTAGPGGAWHGVAWHQLDDRKGCDVTSNGNGKGTALAPVEATANVVLAVNEPYQVELTIQGTAPILFHRWNVESVAAKSAAAKGSTQKKTDDIGSYVYRCSDGTIGIPGEYLRGAISGPAGAAKYRQDPRSPRKSALDLYKAAVVSLTECASLGKADWDYLDQRRVTVQRNGITRMRPAFLAGWRATFRLQVLLPEYVGPMDLLDVTVKAGQLVGVGDFRPSYGRFAVVQFDVDPVS